MSEPNLHLLINPTAGRGKAGRRLPRILKLLAEADLEPVVHSSTVDHGLEAMTRTLAHDADNRLIVVGGDGSLHEVVNGILGEKSDIPFAVIPSGTGNDFAKAAEIPLDWVTTTMLLSDRLASNSPARKLDAGRINQRFFVNGAGIGFDAKVTRIAKSIRWPVGDLVYLIALLRAMIGPIATPNLRLSAAAPIWDGPVTLASINNGTWVGGMFHIAPMAWLDDGKLELLIAAPVGRRRILQLVPMLMRGEHLDEDELAHRQITKLLIESDEPVECHLDGELQAPQQRFEIEVLPNVLRLI